MASGQWSVASVDLSEESAFLWGGADCRRLVTDHWPLITDLFSAGMGFALAGEYVVGPDIFAGGRGLGCTS